MKKAISVFTMLCLVALSCLAFVSCDSISEDDLKNNPADVLADAYSNTLDSFFFELNAIGDVFDRLVSDTKTEISFDSGNIIPGDKFFFSETVFYEEQTNRFVLDTGLEIDNQDLFFRMFVDENGIAVNSNDVLGSNKTLLLKFESLKDDFFKSDFAMLTGLNELEGEFKNYLEDFDISNAESNEDICNAYLNDALKLLSTEVTSEKIQTADGKKASCVVGTYVINNENLKALYELMVENTESYADYGGYVEEYIKEIFDKLDEYADINVVVKAYINKRTAELDSILIDGTITDLLNNEVLTVDGDFVFGETKHSTTIKLTDGDEDIEFNTALEKVNNSDKTEYKLVASASETENEIEVLVSRAKKDGALTLSVSVSDGYSSEEMIIMGNLAFEKSSVKLVLDTYKYNNDEFSFNLTVSVSATEDVPDVPENAMDIVDLNVSDIQTILEEIVDGKFFELFN